jgi:hypothetical protein
MTTGAINYLHTLNVSIFEDVKSVGFMTSSAASFIMSGVAEMCAETVRFSALLQGCIGGEDPVLLQCPGDRTDITDWRLTSLLLARDPSGFAWVFFPVLNPPISFCHCTIGIEYSFIETSWLRSAVVLVPIWPAGPPHCCLLVPHGNSIRYSDPHFHLWSGCHPFLCNCVSNCSLTLPHFVYCMDNIRFACDECRTI